MLSFAVTVVGIGGLSKFDEFGELKFECQKKIPHSLYLQIYYVTSWHMKSGVCLDVSRSQRNFILLYFSFFNCFNFTVLPGLIL